MAISGVIFCHPSAAAPLACKRGKASAGSAPRYGSTTNEPSWPVVARCCAWWA